MTTKFSIPKQSWEDGFGATHILNLSLNYFYKYCATLLLFAAFVAKFAIMVIDDVR